MRFIRYPMSVLILALAGCGPSAPTIPATIPTVPPAFYTNLKAKATVAPKLTALAATSSAQQGTLRQWANTAQAEFVDANPDYAAANATGAPDFYPKCSGANNNSRPSGHGWVSTGGAELNDTLTLSYETPVTPTAVNVYEITDHIGAIIRVDVIDTAGNPIVVYEGDPFEEIVCGQIFSVGITTITEKVDRVVIHFDRKFASVWKVRFVEIDAVELVGNP